MRKVYYIWISEDPSTRHPDGIEYIDSSKGAFTSKEVAEGIRDFMRLFQEEGDRSYISVRELSLYEEATLDEWMEKHGPGAQKETG